MRPRASRWAIAGAALPGPARSATMDRIAAATIRDAAGEKFLVLALADGAGSARRGGAGAAIATASFLSCLQRAARGRLVLTPRRLAAWYDAARRRLHTAPRAGETVRDYHCTFIAAIIGETRAGFLQIGDGILALRPAGRDASWRPLFRPHAGTFANETVFLDGATAPHIAVSADPPAGVALFSDGLDPIFYHSAAHRVAGALLERLHHALRRPATDALRNRDLAALLARPVVRARVGDDTALLIARRS